MSVYWLDDWCCLEPPKPPPTTHPPWLLLQHRTWLSKDLQHHPVSAPGPAPGGELDWGPQLTLFVKYFEYHPEWSGWGAYTAHSPVQHSDQSPDRTPALGKGPFLHNKALFRMSFKYITMMQLRPSVPLWGS